jgi:hypothetical protein
VSMFKGSWKPAEKQRTTGPSAALSLEDHPLATLASLGHDPGLGLDPQFMDERPGDIPASYYETNRLGRAVFTLITRPGWFEVTRPPWGEDLCKLLGDHLPEIIDKAKYLSSADTVAVLRVEHAMEAYRVASTIRESIPEYPRVDLWSPTQADRGRFVFLRGQGKSLSSIARDLGVGFRALREWLDRDEVDVTPRSKTRERDALIMEAFRKGESAGDIADSFGLSLSRVYQIKADHREISLSEWRESMLDALQNLPDGISEDEAVVVNQMLAVLSNRPGATR